MTEHQLQFHPMGGQRVNWYLLRDALGKLDIGDTLALITNYEYFKSARSAVYRYGIANKTSFKVEESQSEKGTWFLHIERVHWKWLEA